MEESPPRRRSIRLRDYDYRESGAYFITICTHRRASLFGEITMDEMRLNMLGVLVQRSWGVLPEHFPNVELDAFVIMPNHVHAVVVLFDPENKPVDNAVGATHASPLPAQFVKSGPPSGSLGAVIGSFKAAAAKATNEFRATPGSAVWQRGYYDHIIRSEKSLTAIRAYILYNPARWASDENNPAKLK